MNLATQLFPSERRFHWTISSLQRVARRAAEHAITGMSKSEFKDDLTSQPISYLVSKWILERTPYIFEGNNYAYISWKEELAENLGVDSRAIIITGSAGCGFSLNPAKDYRDFNDESDVDVALVSQYYFDVAWHGLRTLGTRRYDLTPRQRAEVDDHVKRLIYWGTIATDKILSILPFGKRWIPALEVSRPVIPINGREIKVRVYRDFESLRAYQTNGFGELRSNLTKSDTTIQ